MSYKVFVNGYPLNASELNQYLMSQTIAVFVDATARDAAIETPVEGQFCYLTGSNELLKFDGSAWVSYSPTTPVSQISTNYTIVAGDANTYVYATAAATVTIADVLSPGETINFIQDSADAITFAAGTGVTLKSKDSKLSTNGQNGGASVTCKEAGVYYLVGDLA